MFKKLSLIAALFLMYGCASIQVDPQNQKIVASPNPPPKGCKYLGEITGNQGNFFTGAWTSNKNLEEGARNDMKNQAGKLGANYVQLVASRGGNTGSFDAQFGGSMQQTNVTYTGNAYRCPAALIGL